MTAQSYQLGPLLTVPRPSRPLGRWPPDAVKTAEASKRQKSTDGSASSPAGLLSAPPPPAVQPPQDQPPAPPPGPRLPGAREWAEAEAGLAQGCQVERDPQVSSGAGHWLGHVLVGSGSAGPAAHSAVEGLGPGRGVAHSQPSPPKAPGSQRVNSGARSGCSDAEGPVPRGPRPQVLLG